MKKSALILASLASFSLLYTNAVFAKWEELGANEQMVVYVDMDTITVTGESAQILSMLDFKKPGENPANKKQVSSIIGINEYNCPDISYRPIQYKEFSGPKGTGSLVSDNQTPNSKFEPVIDRSWSAGVFKVVCKPK